MTPVECAAVHLVGGRQLIGQPRAAAKWRVRRERAEPSRVGVFVTPDALLIADGSPWVLRVPRSAVIAVDLDPGSITTCTRLRVRVPMTFWRGSPWSNLIDLDATAADLDPLFDRWLVGGAVPVT